MHTALKHKNKMSQRRQIAAAAAVFVVLLLAVALAFGLQGDSQHKTNEFYGVYQLSSDTTQTATLTITKKVVNADGSALTAAQVSRKFSFTVTFYKLVDGQTVIDTTSAYPYYLAGGGASGFITSGQSLLLAHSQRAVISLIAPGTLYQVSEASAPGYSTTSTGNSGNIAATGSTAAYINTCAVQKGKLLIEKQVTNAGGSDPDTAQLQREFTFHAVIDSTETTFTLKAGQVKLFTGLSLDATYTVTEVADPDYTATRNNYSGTISRETTITLPFVNVAGGQGSVGSLSLRKELDGDGANPDKAFSFTISFAGADVPSPLYYHIDTETEGAVDTGPSTELGADGRFNLKGKQTIIFEDLPDGTVYSVAEDDYSAGGYKADISAVCGTVAGSTKTTLTVTNTYHEQKPLYLTVKKITEGKVPKRDAGKLFHFTVTIDGVSSDFDLVSGQESEPIELHQGDHYEVFERDYTADGWTQTAVVDGDGTAGTLDIEAVKTNTYSGHAMIDISGVKTWDLTGAPAGTLLPDSITLELRDGARVVSTVVIKPDAQGQWSYRFRAPAYRADDVTPIAYTVAEEPVDGWTAVVSGTGITNTWTDVRYTSVAVVKYWDDAESTTRPKSVMVQLYCDGRPYGAPAVLDGSMSWKRVWSGLDGAHTWTVDEAGLPAGYTRTVTGTADVGFVITNTLKGKGPHGGGGGGSGNTTETPKPRQKTHKPGGGGGGGGLAKTGDFFSPGTLWLVVLATGFAVLLLGALTYSQRHRRRL